MIAESTVLSEIHHPYQLQSFFECWWQYLSPKFDIVDVHHNLAIHRREMCKGVALKELRYAGWNNAWSQDFDQRCYEQFASLQPQSQWDYLALTWPESRRAFQRFELLTELGLEIFQKPSSTAYWVDLHHGFDAYLSQLSAAKRKDIRRKLKKSEALHPELRRFSGIDGIQQFFSLFFKHHLAYWTQKAGHSYFSDLRERDFIVAWAQALEEQGALLLEGFYLNGTLTNLTMNILMGHTLYSVMTINTGEYQEFAPGLLSLYHRMARATEYNILQINLGDGEHGYKAGIANRTDPYYSLLLANPKSIRGQAYVNYVKYKTLSPIQIPEITGISAKIPDLGRLFLPGFIPGGAVASLVSVA
ncbi:GNAT family N-acetyltransferase [Vampirovibrio chlorellavorus]|uniref:GNAT family N-acetyltransferase n=1 Tax=Vampirovibrio chlorellavorus TaxID=758823 RepID=UPI0026F0ACDF|nr:GNAT family N-acetyltransferase [Vampirovibrio chlorellavorus]